MSPLAYEAHHGDLKVSSFFEAGLDCGTLHLILDICAGYLCFLT